MRRLFDGHPAHRDEHLDDDQRHRDVAAGALPGGRRGAEPRRLDRRRQEVAHRLAGTTQNDIVKEYLSRGTYVFPPEHSLRLITDVIAYTVHEIPNWNPINICSYHLQEAGATPTQELAYALCTAIAVLDAVQASGPGLGGGLRHGRRPDLVLRQRRRPVRRGDLQDARVRRAVGPAHPRAVRRRGPAMRRFRYGVQVNSLGLTEAQPENNVQRIVLEMLGVTLSKDARARAVQLPAWNEALGLPRPWDQQWSLRLQQVLAYESDLLEYDDIFDGLARDRGEGRRARRERHGRDGPGAGDGRRDRRRRERLHEAGAGLRPRRPARPDRVGRGGRGRASTGSRPPSRRR